MSIKDKYIELGFDPELIRSNAYELAQLMSIDREIDWAFSPWHVDDISLRAEDIGEILTRDEALDALEFCIDNHDANIGINWDSIDFAINEILDYRALKESKGAQLNFEFLKEEQ